MTPTGKKKKLPLWVGPLSFSPKVDFSFRPIPSYGRRSMISLISHLNSVLQIKPISWTSSRTQSYRSSTTQTLWPTTCKCIEATDQTLICTFKSFPIGSLCPAAYLSNLKHIFPNKFIYSNSQNHKGLLSFLPIAPSDHLKLTASEKCRKASFSDSACPHQ